MDEKDEDEYWQLQRGLWGSHVQESMRGRQKVRTNPSREDRKVRRRNRRTTAGGDVQKRAELVRALSKTSSFSEQARLLDEIRKIDEGLQAQAVQGRELDFANAVVRETLAPVRVHEHHTEATDWLGTVASANEEGWQNRVVAEAAMWFGRVPDFVKANAEEFGIQAEGKARQIAGAYGLQMEAAKRTFVDYVSFLHKQSASGLDQIQQTVDPHDNPKTTPLPLETFDTFAPEVDPINAGVSGTETSERNPMIQEIMQGGSTGNPGQPEKPGGHSTDDELSWNPPQGMQQDSTPPLDFAEGPSDQKPRAPGNRVGAKSRADQFGDYMHDEDVQDALDLVQRHRQHGCPPSCPGGPDHGQGHIIGDDSYYASLRARAAYDGRSVAIGYTMSMDDFRAQASRKAGGQGKGRKEAASGLDQIQQTVDPHDNPKPTGLPPEVAFPLDEEFQEEWTTNGTGTAQPKAAKARGKAVRKKADMYGNSDNPHAVPGGPVSNNRESTPPPATQGGGRPAGVADANANNAPTFADNSSHIPAPAQGYAQGYSSVDQTAGIPKNVPPSMLPPGQGTTPTGDDSPDMAPGGARVAKVSSLIVTAKEMENADFKKGYGYGSRWKPGVRLVATGSKEFEAGLYAGISDNPEHQRAFVAAHRSLGKKFPKMAARVEQHVRVTHRVASKNEHPSNGLYLTAATSIDLATTAPNTTPAADGSTPINGPGRPGPLNGGMDPAAPGGPAPYNGAPPYGTPVVPSVAQSAASPADALIGGGHMSTPNQVMGSQALAFRRRVQSALLAQRQGK